MRTRDGKTIPVYTDYHWDLYSGCVFTEFPTLWEAKADFFTKSQSVWVDKASTYMDVYLKDNEGMYEPYTRFTIGARGGIVRENY